MPIFRYFTIVGSALLAFIFASDAYFGGREGQPRFNGSLNESAVYAPRPEELVATKELRFTRDVTPAARVREVFSQYVANDGTRWKRDIATASVDDRKGNSHLSAALFGPAVYPPRSDEVAANPKPPLTTPAERIREVFALFVPDEASAGNATPPPPWSPSSHTGPSPSGQGA